MRAKLASMKKQKKDIEIESGDSDEDFDQPQRDIIKKDGAVTRDMISGDNFFVKGEDENETAEEKRLRMTKKLISELGEESKKNDDFFFNL